MSVRYLQVGSLGSGKESCHIEKFLAGLVKDMAFHDMRTRP